MKPECIFGLRSEIGGEGAKKEKWGWWKLSRSGMGKVLRASCGLKFYEWKVDW